MLFPDIFSWDENLVNSHTLHYSAHNRLYILGLHMVYTVIHIGLITFKTVFLTPTQATNVSFTLLHDFENMYEELVSFLTVFLASTRAKNVSFTPWHAYGAPCFSPCVCCTLRLEEPLGIESLQRRHVDGSFTSDMNKVLDNIAAKEYLLWVMNSKPSVARYCDNQCLEMLQKLWLLFNCTWKQWMIGNNSYM